MCNIENVCVILHDTELNVQFKDMLGKIEDAVTEAIKSLNAQTSQPPMDTG